MIVRGHPLGAFTRRHNPLHSSKVHIDTPKPEAGLATSTTAFAALSRQNQPDKN